MSDSITEIALSSNQNITCPAVANVRSITQTQKQITLKWSAVSNADGYEIYFYNRKSKSYKKVKTVTGKNTKTVVKNLISGTVYKCKVRAYRNTTQGKVYGSYSKSITIATAGKTPALTSVKNSKDGLKIKWNKSATASGYEVYIKTGNGKFQKAATIKSGKTTTYQYKKAKSGKNYTVKLRAYQTVNGKKVYTSFSKTKKIKL